MSEPKCQACGLDYCMHTLEKQLAERDAALARCVEVLAYYAISRDIYSGEDIWLYAAQTLDSIPTSTQATAKVLAECKWTKDVAWDTECGNSFLLNDGTPKQNSMAFCPYCGKAIREEQADRSSEKS